MPEMKHNFQRGRMNKDLDERIVPDGEYREALNIEVSTSEDGDVGTLQTSMGNTLLSQIDPNGDRGFVCVGSIEDSKNNKLYWFATSTIAALNNRFFDVIAEYDYVTGNIVPVCVDVHTQTNRVLKFDEKFHITGLNVMDEVLYWTDNNSEPKKVNIERCKAGTTQFNIHTNFMVKDISTNAVPGNWINSGLDPITGAVIPEDIREDHLTIIRKGPLAAPVLVMEDTEIIDIDGDELVGGGELNASITPVSFININDGEFLVTITITTNNSTDFSNGSYLLIYSENDPVKKVRVHVDSSTHTLTSSTYVVTILSGNKEIEGLEDLRVKTEQREPLFQFKFPRFAVRYKYEDGEYSQFSPFTEVAFLPGRFDYMPKEGYNLGMVNNLRKLAIKNFVYTKVVPEDVTAIDILYKESNSPNIYSVKQVRRKLYDNTTWDAWNADSPTSTTQFHTKGYLPITTEMIHAVLPSNQLLRPWDNVPRKALAQEIIGNRLVYGNYLQNYNLDNQFVDPAEQNIKPDIDIAYYSRDVHDLFPQEVHAGNLDMLKYNPAKSIKTLRTYHAGVVYLDKYGRETPVLTGDTRGSITSSSGGVGRSSVYVPKEVANKRTNLSVSLRNTAPEWATHYKLFIKETSNEYYNLAMDRWYEAGDDNIWLSFPSADRNKVDEETFLILKKEHDNSNFVSDPARYKIIAIENEAPRHIKLTNVSIAAMTDYEDTVLNIQVFGLDMSSFPYEGGTQIYIRKEEFEDSGMVESLINQDVSQVYFRIKTNTGISNYYQIATVAKDNDSNMFVITSKKEFGADMAITSPTGQWIDRVTNSQLEVIKRLPEDRAEFEGRFFVKILKDFTLIEKLGLHSGPLVDYKVKISKKFQYINPMSTWALAGNGDWYGQNRTRISLDARNQSMPGTAKLDAPGGAGAEYWKHAAKCVSSPPNDSNSSGWFIDEVEGFALCNTTFLQFGHDPNSDRWETEWPDKYFNCMWWTGRPDERRSQTKELQKCLGVNTYDYSWGNTNYLGISNVRGPVRRDGQNTVEAGASIHGGGAGPSRGIDGNYIHLSYAGLGEATGGSGNGRSNWTGIEFYFDDAIKHASDTAFINKLTQPGAIFTWAEDPGLVMYKTQTIASSHPNEVNDRDGAKGRAMYNYACFSDFWYDVHHNERGYWKPALWGAIPSGDCYCNKDGLISRSKISTVTPSFQSGNTWTPNPETCLPGIGTWICCAGNQSLSGVCTHCPESHDAHVAGADKTGSNCDWTVPDHRIYPVGAYDWNAHRNKRRRFLIKAVPLDNTGNEILDLSGNNLEIGGVGPHYYKPTNSPDYASHFDANYNPITTNPQTSATFIDPAPGIRTDGMHSAYNDPDGSYVWNGQTISDIPLYKRWDSAGAQQTRAPGSVTWQIREMFVQDPEDARFSSTNPAIWETEPKEDVGLDIYHEVGQIYPLELNDNTIEQHVGAVQPDITKNSYVTAQFTFGGVIPLSANGNSDIRIVDAVGSSILLGAWNGTSIDILGDNPTDTIPPNNSWIVIWRADGSATGAIITQGPTSGNLWCTLHPASPLLPVTIPWFNCYSFGNGVESDRIRDDYNQVKIDNGPKASTTLEETYLEERRCSGFIWSGIYNSNSGVNDLNQFIQAEAITKDVNPGYGCIQKMHARDNDLVAFCEDRVLKVYANKDALYNADGNTNVVATNRVLGAVKPFLGDYGISKNPESFASDSYRSYFADASRGAVVRLSQDGLTPISDAGMKDWFSDVLPKYAKISNHKILGSFDDKKQEYNITLTTDLPSGVCDRNGNGSVTNTAPSGTICHEFGITGNAGLGLVPGSIQPSDWASFSSASSITNNPADVLFIDVSVTEYNGVNIASWLQDLLVAVNTGTTYNLSIEGDNGGGPLGEVVFEVDSVSAMATSSNGGSYYRIYLTWFSGNYPLQAHSSNICYYISSGTTGNNGTIIQNIEDEINYTLAYSESSRGWTSFRSYLQESGVSLNNEYFTFKNGEVYLHHDNQDRNNFYGVQYDSYVSVLMNQAPSIVKSFKTISYEGSEAQITSDLINPEYYDNEDKDGWYVSRMITNLQEVDNLEFVPKEEKYFSQIKGVKTIWTGDGTAGNIDPKEFSFQGIGNNTELNPCPNCDPTISWNCSSSIGSAGAICECVQVSGSQGSYPTRAACENDTNSCCSASETWCCTSNGCVDPGDGSGDYSSLCDCVMNAKCCDDGANYLYCMGLPTPSPYIVGCMDDGITTDPFMTQDRPNGWVGPATNYDVDATVPDCSCLYETLPTYDCIEGNCEENQTGNGFYTGPNALNDCIMGCSDPCDNQNMGIQTTITNPTELEPPCALSASDGSVSVMVTNNNSTSPNPFTSWTVEYYDSIWSPTGPPTIGSLIYSDPSTYATGVWSNTYVGLTTANNGTESYNVYYAVITDNNGCEYGPFTIRINCVGCATVCDLSTAFPWDYTVFYTIGSVVEYNGSFYSSINDGDGAYPDINTDMWEECCETLGQVPAVCDCAVVDCGTFVDAGNFSMEWPPGSGNTYWPGDDFCCNWQFNPLQQHNPSCPGAPDGIIDVQTCASFPCPPGGVNPNSTMQLAAYQQYGFGANWLWIWSDANGDPLTWTDQMGNIHQFTGDMCTWLTAGTYTIEVFNCLSDDALSVMGGTYETIDGVQTWIPNPLYTGEPYYGCTQVGCSDTVTVTLTDPPRMDLSFSVTDDNASTSVNDGAIDLTVTGGSGPFTYEWTDLNGSVIATTQNISGLALGPYHVTVTGAEVPYYNPPSAWPTPSGVRPGCTATGSAFVLQN